MGGGCRMWALVAAILLHVQFTLSASTVLPAGTDGVTTPTPAPSDTTTRADTPTPAPTDTTTLIDTPTPAPTDTTTLIDTPTPAPTDTTTLIDTPTPAPSNTTTLIDTPTPALTDTTTLIDTPTPAPTDTTTVAVPSTPEPTDTSTLEDSLTTAAGEEGTGSAEHKQTGITVGIVFAGIAGFIILDLIAVAIYRKCRRRGSTYSPSYSAVRAQRSADDVEAADGFQLQRPAPRRNPSAWALSLGEPAKPSDKVDDKGEDNAKVHVLTEAGAVAGGVSGVSGTAQATAKLPDAGDKKDVRLPASADSAGDHSEGAAGGVQVGGVQVGGSDGSAVNAAYQPDDMDARVEGAATANVEESMAAVAVPGEQGTSSQREAGVKRGDDEGLADSRDVSGGSSDEGAMEDWVEGHSKL